MIRDLGRWDDAVPPRSLGEIDWTHWQPLAVDPAGIPQRWTQILDFETAHSLFMCLFCLC